MSLSDHRGNWSFVGKDVVVLHCRSRAAESSPCPAGIAVETFLKANRTKYISDHDAPFDPVVGTTPWITQNGKDAAGAHFIVKHLGGVGPVAEAEKALCAAERATAGAVIALLDERFEWCLRLDRFLNKNDADKGGCFAGFLGRRRERAALDSHHRGIGKLKRSDAESLGLEALKTVSDLMADKSYVLGIAGPTRVDCVLFGYVAAVLKGTEEHQVYHRAIVAGEFKNLKAHHDRLLDKLWQGRIQ